jgi:hypothetical protein
MIRRLSTFLLPYRFENKTNHVHHSLLPHVIARLVVLLVGDNLLDTNSRLNSDNDRVFTTIPGVADFLAHAFRPSGEVQIGLLVASFVHEGEFIAIDIDDFPVALVDNRDSGTVGGGDHIFVLLSSEDIGGGKVALCVTVLSRLGNGNVEDLAGLSLDHHESDKGKQKYE